MPSSHNQPPNGDGVYNLAAGLLAKDATWVPVLYLVLILPALVSNLFSLERPDYFLFIISLRLVLSLSVVFFVSSRWLRNLSVIKPSWEIHAFLLTLTCGILVWLPPIMCTTVLTLSVSLDLSVQTIALFLLIPATIMLLRYYFFFIPGALNVASIRQSMHMARSYTKLHRWLPLKALTAPFALECLAISLVQIPAPDGRSFWVNWLVIFCSGIFWLLSCYNGLAFGLQFMEDSTWREHHLDPYRQGRLETIAARGQSWLATLLKPSNGIKVLLVAVLVGLANMTSLINTPPSVTLQVESLTIRRNMVAISLAVADPQHHFRGFNPYYLRLAGEKGEEVAAFPKKVLLGGNPLPPSSLLPSDTDEPVHLKVFFETNRNKESLKDLEDLYLWYLASRILRL
ncbi:MAG: hypothetical protein GX589_00155, partial [Deltaproteobacteria bacterium]|nr:hypothetical protein [Deltaproteobacteria bacterium]